MDSVPYDGKYNGFYGVIAGLEILRSVKDLNITTNIQFH
jgi:N-carbamoyl-L-amino-acid hydrolase